MKKFTQLLILITVFGTTLNLNAQREQDSLALVALYNSTDGANWNNSTNWLSSEPIDTWYGVTVTNNRVNYINLSDNNLAGSLPADIGNLTSLIELDLRRNQIGLSIPTQIGNLTLLNKLDLSENQFQGAIPVEIGNLINLNILWLSYNQLAGSIPTQIENLINLTTLYLENNPLTGSIPTQICSLTNLVYLCLNWNQLTGSIPPEIGNLTNLKYLSLSNNQLSGSIPSEIGNLINLTQLNIYDNQLSGSIPIEFWNMIELKYLMSENNQLSGSIPSQLGNLVELQLLDLRNNQLSGTIPSEIGNCIGLDILQLSSNNLTGSIPAEIGNLPRVNHVDLGNNQLTGSIPVEIWNLIKLYQLKLNNNQLTGSIPTQVENLIVVDELLLNNNQLGGVFPIEINNLSQLRTLKLNDNKFDFFPVLTLGLLNTLETQNNQLTFEDIEPNVGVPNFSYSPQDSIGIKKDTVGIVGDEISLSVSGGGNIFQWYKDDVAIADGGNISGANAETLLLINLDISDEGEYHCEVMNSNAPDLTLYSRPITLSVSTSIQTVTDIDGNVYNTVEIGNQTWMAENLKTTRYDNGDDIGTTTPVTLDISGETEPKYQWAYDGDNNNVDTNGRLYTWYVATDSRNLCPSGWHVPSNDEWQVLYDYLVDNGYGYEGDGYDIAKSMAATFGWSPNATPGTTGNDQTSNNSTGFTVISSGGRHSSGVYNLLGETGFLWSTTEIDAEIAWERGIDSDGSSFLGWHYNNNKRDGYSVRCLKDFETSVTDITVSNATTNEGDPVVIPISVSELTAADNIISYQFDIDFDNVVLEYTGNDIIGTLAEGGTIEVNTAVAGKLSISYMTSTAIQGAGDILKLQFNTLVTDTTELLISNAYLNSTEVTDLTTGIVIIKDVTAPTAAVTFNDTDVRCGDELTITATFSEPMLASNAVNISLSGAAALADAVMTRISATVYTYNYSVPKAYGDVTVSLSKGTDLWSNEVVSTPTSGGSFTIIGLTLGDVDDDGKILAYDAALTLQHSVGLDPLPAIDALPWENWRDSTANVDGTAGITANDAGMILQYSAGLITDFLGSSKKSTPQAFISMEFVDEGIIFYSYGELLGLNVSVDNDIQILGDPVILGENFMSAFNINDTVYRVGLCSTHPPADGEAILKIPFNKNGSVDINMIINDVTRTYSLNLTTTTGVNDFGMTGISIYPNPVRDYLKVSGLSSETVARIYDLNGKLMHTSILTNSESELNVSDLSVGLYIIKLETDKETTVKRFIIR